MNLPVINNCSEDDDQFLAIPLLDEHPRIHFTTCERHVYDDAGCSCTNLSAHEALPRGFGSNMGSSPHQHDNRRRYIAVHVTRTPHPATAPRRAQGTPYAVPLPSSIRYTAKKLIDI